MQQPLAKVATGKPSGRGRDKVFVLSDAVLLAGLGTVLLVRRGSGKGRTAGSQPEEDEALGSPGIGDIPGRADEVPDGADSDPISVENHLLHMDTSSAVPPELPVALDTSLTPVAAEADEPEVFSDDRTEPPRIHRLAVTSLAELAAKVTDLERDTDLAVALPAGAAVVIGDDAALAVAAESVSGTWLAASPLPFTSDAMTAQVAQAVTSALGRPVVRCHPHPYALLGTVAQVRALLTDTGGEGDDGDRLAAVLLSGRHPIVLDTTSQLFHVLDGTATDVSIVAGVAHVAGERPLVLIDLDPQGAGLAAVRAELADGGARDLARLLRYDGAAAPDDGTPAPVPDGLATPLWTPDFCRTVIRAAEAAAVWTNDTDDDPNAAVGIWLHELSPCLFSLLETDLDKRVAPHIRDRWPGAGEFAVAGAMVVRCHAGFSRSRLGFVQDRAARFRGSVKLNEGYRGGALMSGSQSWSDAALETGVLAVWPAPAHPLDVTPVTSGVRYSLAIWWQAADG